MSVWKLFSDNGQDRLCYASMEHPVDHVIAVADQMNKICYPLDVEPFSG